MSKLTSELLTSTGAFMFQRSCSSQESVWQVWQKILFKKQSWEIKKDERLISLWERIPFLSHEAPTIFKNLWSPLSKLGALKVLTNFKVRSTLHKNFSSGFPSLQRVGFLHPCTPPFSTQRQFMSLAAFGTSVRTIGGYQKTRTSSLKRISVRIFRSSKCFHRSKQN